MLSIFCYRIFGFSLNMQYICNLIFYDCHMKYHTTFVAANTQSVVLLLAFLAFFTSACSPTAPTKAPLQVPTTYSTTNFAGNTSTETALMANLATLTSTMQQGRPGAPTATNRNQTVSAATLRMIFTQASSLSELCTPYYRNLIVQQGGWIDQLAAASGRDMTLTNPGIGGRFGGATGYLFNQFGLEPEQAIEKGLFGAALFNRITTLLTGNVTAAALDQALVLYGAPTNFPNGRPVMGQPNDVAIAQYAARRDNSGGGPGGNTGAQGYYTQIRDAFLRAQAAIAAGSAYNAERDSATAFLLATMERALAATVVNYCHSSLAGLSANNPTDAQIAAALHALGEGVGFIGGLKTVQRKIITDAQIDAILAKFNAPHGQNAAILRFVGNPQELQKISEVIQDVARIYGFTPQQIELFRRNNVNDRAAMGN
jgi:hypothetical protein